MRRLPVAALFALLGGCVPPFDLLGEEETVVRTSSGEPPDELQDDDISTKHPPCDPKRTIDVTLDSCAVTLNQSCAVTKLDIVPFPEGQEGLGLRLFPRYQVAANSLGANAVLPSMEVVNASLKPFDDGLYAAVELAAEDGSDGSSIAKGQLWKDLLATLTSAPPQGAGGSLAGEAASQLEAAISLGGGQAALSQDAQSLASRFRSDKLHATPIGFYTWLPGLSAIFARDRFLQSPPEVAPSFGALAATASVLNGNPHLATRYGQILDLYAGLTNPSFDFSPRDLQAFVSAPDALGDVASVRAAFTAAHPSTASAQGCPARVAFAPASDSPESRLFRALYCDAPIAPGGNLIDVLIRRIRAGAVDLTPTASSGWYDRQLYALETLLVPDKSAEDQNLFLTARYKQKLVETFKTLITEARETHVEHVSIGSQSVSATIEPTPVDISPVLPVEPFPTFYVRTARAYAFVHSLLRTVMGDAFLTTAHRVLEDGSRATRTLEDELSRETCRLYGLEIVAERSIGTATQMTLEEQAAFPPATCEQNARDWLAHWSADPDVARDPRVIVPIEHDESSGTVRYWAVTGVKAYRMEASFYPGHEPEIVRLNGPGFGSCFFRSFIPYDAYLLTGAQVEVTIRDTVPPLTRERFRAICDEYRSVDAIVAALEAL